MAGFEDSSIRWVIVKPEPTYIHFLTPVSVVGGISGATSADIGKFVPPHASSRAGRFLSAARGVT